MNQFNKKENERLAHSSRQLEKWVSPEFKKMVNQIIKYNDEALKKLAKCQNIHLFYFIIQLYLL